MTRKLLVGAIVAGALAVTAGTAFALSSGGQPSPSATSTTAPTATSTSTSNSTSTPTSSSTPTSTSSSTPTSPGAAPAPGELSANDAARVVQERMGGTVHEVEREMEHGRLEWKVEITARDGITYDVRVDAATGDFTRVEQDDRDGGRDDDRDDDRGRHGGDDDNDRGDDHGGDRDDD